jgi:hypothetical protein
MSYSVCATCGLLMRDTDDPPAFVMLWLPDHTDPASGLRCVEPNGGWVWNDGRHYWDDDRMEFVATPPPECPGYSTPK